MKNITVISNARHWHIELTHHKSDPGIWIVRHSKKFLWFKKRISSNWFIDGKQALAFAHELKRNGNSGSRKAREISQNAE